MDKEDKRAIEDPKFSEKFFKFVDEKGLKGHKFVGVTCGGAPAIKDNNTGLIYHFKDIV